MKEKARIFISYAHRDGAELAQQLCNDLVERKYNIWLDKARLSGGSQWSQEIERALDSSDVVLALLSTGSFESEICRGEQLRSLRHHKCVIPVLVHADPDRPVYLEARQYRDFSEPTRYSRHLQGLIQDIEGRSGATLAPGFRETRYDTVPPLPLHFVPRPAELEALRHAVLGDRDRRNVALVALKGMGGIGKTVLAQALCRDEAVQAAFPDGIVWVKIGKNPTDGDLVGQMREAAKALGRPTDGFDTVEGSSRLLRTFLKDKAALLVVDDVWKAEHLYCFQPVDSRFCRLLFTTRNAEIGVVMGAREYTLDVLDEPSSLDVLASCTGTMVGDLPSEAHGIVRECQGLPLALAMIGALLYEEPAARWADVLDSLRQADLGEIRIQFPNYRYPSLMGAIEVSINDLDAELRRLYLDLAVLPEDTPVSDNALESIWGLDGKTTRRIASDFVKRSLLARDKLGHFVLHDLQLDYVRMKAGNLESRHRRLLKQYRQLCSGGWDTGPNDGYFFEHLVYHLIQFGKDDEARSLLLDPRWMLAKLRAAGMVSLISDYSVIRTKMDTMVTLRDALRLSSHLVNSNSSQIAPQLIERLLDSQDPEIKAFLDDLELWCPRPCFSPLVCVEPPGGKLMRTFKPKTKDEYDDGFKEVAVSPDANRIVSIDRRGVTIWDAVLGQELHTFDLRSDHIQLTSKGQLIVFGPKQDPKAFNIHSLREIPVGQLEPQKTLLKNHDLTCWYSESGWQFFFGRYPHTPFDFETWRLRFKPEASHSVLRIFDKTTDNETAVLAGHGAQITTVAVTPDESCVVTGSNDGTIKMWSLQETRQTEIQVPHRAMVTAVGIDAQQKYAVSGAMDGSIKIWDLYTGSIIHSFSVPPPISHVILSVHAGIVLSLSGHGRKGWDAWDLSNGRPRPTPSKWGNNISSDMALTQDGRFLVWQSYDSADVPSHFYLQTMDLRTGEGCHLSGQPGGPAWAICPGPRPETVVCGYWGGQILVWDPGRDNYALEKFGAEAENIVALACTQDGKYILGGSSDGKLILWNVGTGKQELLLRTDSAPTALAIGEDGKYAVALHENGWATAWDLWEARKFQSTSLLSNILLHYGQRTRDASRRPALAVHGTWAIISAVDEVKVWDFAHDSIATSFQCSYGTARDITPNGRIIAVGEGSGTVHFLQLLIGNESSKRLEHDRIARLAYTYRQLRRGEGGSAEEDWARAECEIASRKT